MGTICVILFHRSTYVILICELRSWNLFSHTACGCFPLWCGANPVRWWVSMCATNLSTIGSVVGEIQQGDYFQPYFGVGMHIARAHVLIHTTSDSCKTPGSQVSRYIPNLGTIGPVVAAELQQEDHFRHHLNMRVPRVTVIMWVGRHWSNSW